MRGAYWSALGALAIFVVAVCIALAMLALNAPNDSRGQQEQRARASADKCTAEIRALMPKAGPEAEKAVGEQRTQSNYPDLCQQIRMAVAAENAAWYAKWQWIVSVAGLLGVGVATVYAGLAYSVAKKALFDLERPHVFVDVVSPGLTVDAQGGRISLIAPGGFRYRFSNYGRTPARLLDITLRYPVVDRPRPAMPGAIPVREAPDRTLPNGVVAALGAPYEDGENLMSVLNTDIYERNFIYRKQAFFLGRARYADIFNDVYVVGFCFVFDHIGLRFVRVGDERYNYTRRE